MNDEPGRVAVVGQRQERGRVDVADERLVRRAKGFGVGIGVERVQLARERERIGEVVAAERAQVDAIRARDGEAADGAVGIAELHVSALELRVALLDEGRHPLLLVLGGEEEVEEAPLVGERIGQAHLVGGVHRLLGQSQRERRLRGDLRGQGQRILDDELVLGHQRDEPGRVRLARR